LVLPKSSIRPNLVSTADCAKYTISALIRLRIVPKPKIVDVIDLIFCNLGEHIGKHVLLFGARVTPIFQLRFTDFPVGSLSKRHYMLSSEDLALINCRRGDPNRLGFALMLCCLRFPGRILQQGEQLPAALCAFVAEQLGLDAAHFGDYAERDQTRREQVLEVETTLGLRPLTRVLYRELATWLLPTALATDHGPTLMVEAEFRLLLGRNELTKEGEDVRRFYPLRLQFDHLINFLAALTLRHVIDETSPLFGLTWET
jgi:hypothetical protein